MRISVRNINSELLAPAGSIDSLYAAVNAGADAIYLGGDKFGARAYADNPDTETLLKAMDYAHIHDKKIYLTVNTLLKNEEIDKQLYDYIFPLYKNGLDAVIVQDLGVFEYIKANFKNLDIHASTQMAIMDIEGAKLLKNMGASRIVTARELSLTEINRIHNNVDIEIESFIHGAMCYSYSGLCLFSSIIGGRSGNRGRCAGPCRQPYEVYKENTKINNENSMYALSLRDMNTLNILPQILESGVYSLKIEGRMKSPEYVALVTSIYRKYIDLYYEKGIKGFKISEQDIKKLGNFYTRSGSTTGYYKCHNSKEMVSVTKPAYKNDNEELENTIHKKYCEKIKKVIANAIVYIEPEKEISLSITGSFGTVNVFGEKAGIAKNRPLDNDTVIKQINKTGDSFIEFNDIEVVIKGDAFVPVSHLNDLRRCGIDKYLEHELYKHRRLDELCKQSFDKDGLHNNKQESVKNTIKLSVQISKLEQLEVLLSYIEVENIHISTDLLSVDEVCKAVNLIVENSKLCYINLPRIFRKSGIEYLEKLIEKLDNKLFKYVHFTALNIDEYAYLINNNIKNFAIDNSLYSFNKYAKELFYKTGAKKITLPFELNGKEIRKMSDIRDEVVVYGYIPLMVSAGCVLKNYDKCAKGKTNNIVLKDRLGAKFYVINCCNCCYNVIYNNVPLSLIENSKKLKSMDIGFARINLTIEDKKDTIEIIEKCIDAFVYDKEVTDIKNYTRGHFNRGVL